MKICIDAGHGGNDSGAVGVNSRREKDDTLKMALALQKELAKRGHTVTMTRTSDSYPSLSARSAQANNENADVFVSLHRNAAGADAHGIEVLYRTNSVKTAANDAKSKTLAEELNSRLVNATGFRNRGAKVQNTNTAVLQKTKMPAVTVEAGFVTNVGDNEKFDKNFDALISALADGFEAQFGKGSGAPTAPTSSSTASKPAQGTSTPTAPSQPVQATTALPSGNLYYRIKTKERVYFRSAPQAGNTIMRTLDANVNLKYRGDAGNGYYKVSVDGQSGVGYVASRLTVNNYIAKSDGIAAIQKKLGVTADGIYGKNTADAVMKFQKSKGLTIDGIYGPNTKKALEKV